MSKQSEYINEHGIKAYTQGFGKFGPMEQCNTGEWVKRKDVEPFLHAAERWARINTETEKELAYRIRQAELWREDYFMEQDLTRELQKSCANWKGLSIAMMVASLAVAVIIAVQTGV